MTTLDALLERFDAARQAGPFAYQRHHHHDGGDHGFHVVVGSIVHGNEVGSLPAVVSLIEALNAGTKQFGGRLTIFLGNPEAGAADRRFLEADLNRVFVDEPPDCHEGRRATQIKPILDAADVFLDLHQTIMDSDRGFFIGPFDLDLWHWVRAISGTPTWVTRPAHAAFSAGTVCADEYVRNRGKPGVALELGPKGFDDAQARTATLALERLLMIAEAVAVDPAALEAIADAQPDLDFVQTSWVQPFNDAHMQLRCGLYNFASVSAGERLSKDGTPEITAPSDGLLLFPKYPDYDAEGRVIEPRPGDIVNLLTPLEGHPRDLWAAELAKR